MRARHVRTARLRRLSSFVTAVETLMKDGSNPGGAASHARSTSSGDRVRTRWRLKSSSPKSGWDGSSGGARSRREDVPLAEKVPRGSGRRRGRDETPGRSLGGDRDGASRIQRSPPSGRIAFTQRAYPRTGGSDQPRANRDDRGTPELRRTTSEMAHASDDEKLTGEPDEMERQAASMGVAAEELEAIQILDSRSPDGPRSNGQSARQFAADGVQPKQAPLETEASSATV